MNQFFFIRLAGQSIGTIINNSSNICAHLKICFCLNFIVVFIAHKSHDFVHFKLKTFTFANDIHTRYTCATDFYESNTVRSFLSRDQISIVYSGDIKMSMDIVTCSINQLDWSLFKIIISLSFSI